MNKLLPIISLLIGVAYAHSGPHVVRYLATDGRDEGNCDQAASPCRSFDYVISLSIKGDEVKVAKGEYHMSSEARFNVIADIIRFEGGYSRKNQFAERHADNTTLLTAIPGEFSDLLRGKGFDTLQDEKGESIQLSDKERQRFSALKQMTSTIEGAAPCKHGVAAGIYACGNMELLSHIPNNDLAPESPNASDIWGFVDKNDAREYVFIGVNAGTSVVDVTDAKHPRVVDFIAGASSMWRDFAVYQLFDSQANRWKAYAYITTEGVSGLQILDLSELPNRVKNAGTLSTYFTRAHTLYINTDYVYGTAVEGMTPTLFIAGSNANGGSWQALDLSDPLLPKQIFQRADAPRTEYMHDATGMLITDERTSQCAAGHNPCEVLFDFNEQSMAIWDVTEKASPTKLSEVSYDQVGYTHSGWYTQDKRYLFVNDELDERNFNINTALRTLDITDLRSPKVIAQFNGPTKAIDHNTYVVGDYSYIAHYERGLVIMNVKDPVHIHEAAFFDTSPTDNDNGTVFMGAWGVYPFLPSGTIAVSDISGGLYLVKHNVGNGRHHSARSSGGGSMLYTPLLLGLLFVRLCVFKKS